MTRRLLRRGPDDEGLERDGPATLGNRRLAILDLSPAGHQPMRSASGRFRVTFNGEIYNYEDLREELGVDPGTLRSTSDTEILLLAWERWGEAALDRMVGQWAFALWDGRERRLWLARDRFGEKPLFFHRSATALAFASSLDALVQAPWIPRELDPSALEEFATLRYVVSPRTVLAGVEKLPGGHLLCAGEDGARVRRWWRPRYVPAPPRPRAALVEEFDRLLLAATKRCVVSDRPVALLLSDGIDSRSIRASLRRFRSDVPEFTYRLQGARGGVEVDSGAGESATGGPIDLVVSRRERVAQMVPAFSSLTEPVGDGASLATWLLIQHARENATVFLCGHGADEVLGGYRLSQDRFRLAAMRRLAWLPEPWLRPITSVYLNGGEPPAEKLRRLRAAPPRRAPAAARYLIHRPLPFEDVAELFGDRPVPHPNHLSLVDALYATCRDDAADLDRIQEVMLPTFLSENILSFADSVAMDASAELRMPFLDRDLVSFVLGLPPSARVSRWPGRANTKLVLRWWGNGHLPADVVRRRKKTFDFGNLPELLREQGDEVRGYVLGSRAVRRALPGVERWLARPPEYFRGSREGTLWALLALGIWCEHVGVR